MGLFAFIVLISFLQVQFRRGSRVATLESPENPQTAPAASPDSIRVLTYNIAHGRGRALGAENTDGGTPEEKKERLKRIGLEIRALGVDIVFLQEVDFNTWWSGNMDQAEIIADAAGFPYVARQRNFDTGLPFFRRYDFGNVLMSRLPIAEVERLKMPPFSDIEALLAGNHDALLAKINLSEYDQITVLGLHLEVRSEDTRVQAAEKVIAFQRQHSQPMIILGDLNSTPPPMPYAQTSVLGQNAVELLETFGGFQQRPARKQATHHDFTFPTEGPGRTIDWIMPDRNWRIQEYRVVHGMNHSDHLPVLSTLRRR